MSYLIKRSAVKLTPGASWSDPQWANAVEAKLEICTHPEVTHRPDTRAKMLYDDNGIAGVFHVDDRYVIGQTTGDQQAVCRDSCVEFFIHPAGDPRYFNFEMSCTGNLLLYHITNCRAGVFEELPQSELDKIVRKSSLPKRVFPEITDPVAWEMSFYIPIDFFVRHSGISPKLAGQVWQGNFTKCADDSSHPHWLSFIPLSKTDFHLPAEYTDFIFEA